MKEQEIITIVISSLALLVSILSAIFYYSQNYKINRYEFKTSEKTKADILNLTATLSLITKKEIYSHLIKVDTNKERENIIDFLLSDTWVVLNYILIKEEYDNLLLIDTDFLILIYDENINGEIANNLRKEINDVFSKYYLDIIKEKKTLSKNINRFFTQNSNVISWYGKRLNSRKGQEKVQLDLLKNLEKTIVNKDPNINLWIGILSGDAALVKDSLDNGADPKCSLNELLEKYK